MQPTAALPPGQDLTVRFTIKARPGLGKPEGCRVLHAAPLLSNSVCSCGWVLEYPRKPIQNENGGGSLASNKRKCFGCRGAAKMEIINSHPRRQEQRLMGRAGDAMGVHERPRGHASARGRWQLHFKQATQQHRQDGTFLSQGCGTKAVHHRERRRRLSGHQRAQQPLLLTRASSAHLSSLLSKSREPCSPGTWCGEESWHPLGAASSLGRLCAEGQSPDTASGWSSALPGPLPWASLPSPMRSSWCWLC